MFTAEDQRTARVRVGCQGWNYPDWVTPPAAAAAGAVFYPHGTRAGEMLDFYARSFTTVEVDSTFYAVPSVATVDGWAARTPADFTFSLKLPQTITHTLALRGGSEDVLAEFCERVRRLKEKLAVVLIQLPPQFEAVPENLRALREFLPLLPRDVRFSIEFRDGEWFEEDVLEMLTERGVSLALVEGQWARSERIWRLARDGRMTDFAYVRWMGARDITRFDTVVRPQDENLSEWYALIEQLAAGSAPISVYAYFSNFYEGHAPASANKLKRLLGQSTLDPNELEDQPSLF